jgi:hypothetical protein
MEDLLRIFSERGDLAHVALAMWAMSATALLLVALRALAHATRRVEDFVRALARFNDTINTRRRKGR